MGKSTHFSGQPLYSQIMVRINLMYYVDFHSLFNNPEKDWEMILADAAEPPPEPSLFDWGLVMWKKETRLLIISS